MKRKIFQRVMSVLGLSALMFLFFDCHEVPQFQEQQKVKVTIIVADNTARTVLPQASLTDIASYKLLGGRNGAIETILVESFTDTETSVTLDTGTWNFTLNAYNSTGEHILQGKVQNKQINLTGNNQVSFSLSGIYSGTGSIQITLNFPEVAGITRISINGDIGLENFTPIAGDNFVYTKNEITAGDYFINFELYGGDLLRTVVSELVLVRSGLTSNKTITLVGDDLKPIYPTGTVTISPEVSVTIGTELTAVYSGTETVTYQWNKDGTAISDATDTIYKPNSHGSYTVTVNILGNNIRLTSTAVAVVETAVTVSGTTLQEKLEWLANNAESNSNYILEISQSENLSYFELSYSGKSNIVITIKSTGSLCAISLSDSNSMFSVGFGITLVLDDKINLQKFSGGGTLVSVDGTLVMNEGSAITKGGVDVSGNFIMNGGKISGNTSSSSFSSRQGDTAINNAVSNSDSYGGVYVRGNFIMNGGEISSNTSSSTSDSLSTKYSAYSDSNSCGGVYVRGNFIMNGGEISGNGSYSSSTANITGSSHGSSSSHSFSGGGVYVYYGAFTMYGGIISDNNATSFSSSTYSNSPSSHSFSGGGVFVNNGAFTMYGGNISGNTSSSSSSSYASPRLFSGGGVCVGVEGTFIKTSGTVYGYSSGDSNSNVVKDSYGNVQSNSGHAAYIVGYDPERLRRTTAGPTINMNSAVAGTSGGWE